MLEMEKEFPKLMHCNKKANSNERKKTLHTKE